MRQYEYTEIKVKGKAPGDDQVCVPVRGIFEMNGTKKEVKGFYAGGDTYIVRYLSEETGMCRYQITGEDVEGETGEFTVESAAEGRHGVVRADGTHFRYEDGTWYYPFGTTVYAMIHQEDVLVEETFETLAEAPFNKIRICVFPKHYDFNHNEPPVFPFERKDGGWDVRKPCFAYWDRLESCIRRLDTLGIQCDLILFHSYDCWGFADLPKEDALVYLDYAVRRLSAFPNLWWSLANEYDLMDYTMDDWKDFAHFIGENDAYGHLLSNHQIVNPWDFSNPDTTHICQQTGEVEKAAEWIQTYQKPLMVDETGYEGNIAHNWGNLSPFELVNRFWTVCVQGGYCTHGETYLNDEEILWWSKGGKLVGQSPARIRFLRELIESLPGPLDYNGHIITEDEFEEYKDNMKDREDLPPFLQLAFRSPWNTAKALLMAGRELEGHCGEDAYLKYYGRMCTAVGAMKLPEDHIYDLEVIDVWEMTRKPLLEKVSGEVHFTLPGKEGIAVLAKRTDIV